MSRVPVLWMDNRLIGVRYDDGYPLMYFEDDRIGSLMGAIQKLEEACAMFGSILWVVAR